MPRAFVAFGGNVGDARAAIARAVAAFCDGEIVRLVARSSDYLTPPWGVTDQPAFVNACIAVDTELPAASLLGRAQSVERDFGRNREQETRWGPRTLDIDLLTYGGETIDEPGLTLPHPRILERAFVLVPLSEIAPDLTIEGVRVAEACRRVDTAGVTRLPPLAGA